MRLHVDLDAETGRPVVVKEASTADGAERLRREARRLGAARHPGVVEVLETGHLEDEPVCLVLAWAGDRSLETARPPLPVAVALLATVASTVADLHDLGIVHGRLDPTHVVVDAHGRPRLCGMAGAAPDEAEPEPAEDVAALGRLMELLVGPGAEVEPIPDRRWGRRRWNGYQRRALQTLADQACDSDPARRPTARTLARSIHDSLPDARLAPLAPQPPAGVVDPSVVPPPAEDRPPPAKAVGPADGERIPPPEDRPHRPEAPSRPAAPVDTILGLRVVHPSADHGDGEPVPSPRRAVAPRVPRTGAVTRRPTVVAATVIVALGLTGAVGLALRRDEADPSRRPTVVAQAGTPPETAGSRADDRTTASAVHPDPSTPSTTDVRVSGSVPPGCTAVRVPSADVDGDGCPEPVRVDGLTVTAGSERYRVGQAGDLVAVGDWDCDGLATPALVRPATGAVFVFSAWASQDAITVSPAATVTGAAAPADDAPSRCGPLEVRHLDGSVTPVPAPPVRR